MVYWILLVPSFVAGLNCESEAIIKDYFLRGLSYKEILEILEIFYAVPLSLRQLHRILRKQNLSCRYQKSSTTEVTLQFYKILADLQNHLAIV